jgi:hypothetical protein
MQKYEEMKKRKRELDVELINPMNNKALKWTQQFPSKHTDMMSCLLTTARMAQQARGMAVAINDEGRENLSADPPVMLQKLTKEGFRQKFTLMSNTTHNELD